MKNLKLTKPIALLLSGIMLTSSFTVAANAADTDTETTTNDGSENTSSIVTQNIDEVSEILNAVNYSTYIAQYTNVPRAKDTITINAADYDADETDAAVTIGEYGGKSNVLYTPEEGKVSWKIDVPSDALYSVELNYYPIEGKSSNIERAFRIDGKIPFKESRYLSMTKIWKNDLSNIGDSDTAFSQDGEGNDVRPSMYEDPTWITYDFHDSTGYYTNNFEYYLTAGSHEISLDASREPMVLESITLKTFDTVKTYEEVLADYEAQGYKPVSSDATLKISAETPAATSSQTIYPTYDRSSAITEPQDPSKIRLNSIGKSTTWQSVGDWAEWTFTPTESGLYYIVPRFKQSESSDMFVSRKLTINGELPFAEAANLRFNYNDDWQTEPLNNGTTKFQFYFEAGKEYTLRFEAVLGDMSDLLARIESSLTNLNAIYLKIMQITGSTPDTYRDYNFTELIPDEMNMLVKEGNNLYDISSELEAITGERGSNCATLNEIARIAKKMGLDEDEVARNLSTYKTNIGTLGTWMNNARNQPLQIDYFSVQSADDTEKMPRAKASGWQSFVFEMSQFAASFYTDYNTLGNATDTGTETISVWVQSGRDQSQIIRQMINDMFTPETGVNVQLKLVAAGTLLPATLAGDGPDVAYMGGSDPINYAIRSAIQKLNDFDTFDEVCSRFNEQALVPFTLYGDTFAIPETQSFYMMFYREDIFANLGIEVPKTWDELKSILPVLQSQYMNIAMPAYLAGFNLLYYQRGGDLYADDGMRINLDSNLALDTFKDLCDLFTQYQFPLTYDFANRFRTGEMPLGIADYTMYTQMNAFATEIRGLWTMTTLPGYETEAVDDNGNSYTYINNTSFTTASGLVMMAAAKDPDAAWKYIDWITTTDAQTRYGNEYTALLGNSTVHATANIAAMQNMNWSSSELKTLLAQFSNLKATPEYPGSYIVERYVKFAFLDAVNNKADPVEALLSQYLYINKEITRKRKEFGLDTLELGETLADREASTAEEETTSAQ